jgi:hypothetical protein
MLAVVPQQQRSFVEATQSARVPHLSGKILILVEVNPPRRDPARSAALP